jgi:8-oxo-dGTP pyrophosphatase MutT (NUDIX family)
MNPYKVLSSRNAYDNPWIQVTEHQVLLPTGKPGIYGVVHFKNRAIGVIPYEDGHIWMVGQYRFAIGEYSWEIPEGGSPAGEEPLETARRELKEETGIAAEKVEKLVRFHLSNSATDEYGEIFLATGLTYGEAEPEETEDLRLKKVSLDEAYEKVCSGEITDAITIMAVLRIMTLRNEGKL